jgi:hypothetical protein
MTKTANCIRKTTNKLLSRIKITEMQSLVKKNSKQKGITCLLTPILIPGSSSNSSESTSDMTVALIKELTTNSPQD